jgi:serine/threonine protein kinase/cytochrome c-type biogenesis protein CcmH/NrfG
VAGHESSLIGRHVGAYRLEALLGRGGMGEVYRARDTRLGREVAIKILPPDRVDDPEHKLRFLQEARAASALNHPNIVTLHDIVDDGGVDFLVLEYVRGKSLHDLIPPGGMPLADVLAYGTEIAGALAAAHAAGILHRDIKPANVMVTLDGHVKVLDFGLAKLAGPRVTPTSLTRTMAPALTEPGIVMGTVAYMSPEQTRGETVDARTDLFSLGAVLHEMATGRRAFPRAFDWTPPVMSRVPTELRRIVLKLIEPAVDLRYQSAAEVIADLKRIGSTLQSPDRSRRLTLGSADMLGALRATWRRGVAWGAPVVIFLGLALWLQPFTTDRTSPPIQSRLSTGAPASMNPEANEAFERSMVLLRRRWETPQAQKLLTRAVELDPRFAEARAFLGFSHLLQLDSGDSYDGASLYLAEEELRRALQDDPKLVRAHAALGAVYMYLRRRDLAKVEIDEALRLAPDDLSAVQWLAKYSHVAGDAAAAKAALQKNLARDPLFLPSRSMLAEVLREEGQLELSIRETDKVLEQDPENLSGLGSLARAYLDSGNVTKAAATMMRAGEARDRNYLTRLGAAMIYASEGQRAQALQVLDAKLLEFAEAHILGSVAVAEVYAVLDEKDSAVEWLARGVRGGDERLEWLQRDPLLANIRQHPRFRQILESIAYRRQHRNASGQPR